MHHSLINFFFSPSSHPWCYPLIVVTRAHSLHHLVSLLLFAPCLVRGLSYFLSLSHSVHIFPLHCLCYPYLFKFCCRLAFGKTLLIGSKKNVFKRERLAPLLILWFGSMVRQRASPMIALMVYINHPFCANPPPACVFFLCCVQLLNTFINR